MSHRTASWIAWTMWAATLCLSIAHISLDAVTDPRYGDAVRPSFVVGWASALVAFQAFATVGAIVASRNPENPIGWLFCLSALTCQLSNGGGAYVAFAQDHGLPGTIVAGLLLSGTWFLGAYLGVLAPLYVFPDGRPLTRRWRPLVGCVFALPVLVGIAGLFAPGKLDLVKTAENPIGIPGAGYALGGLALTAIPIAILGVVALVLRYRRSRGDERQQLRVFVLTTAVVVSTFLMLALASAVGLGRILGPFDDSFILVLLALIPISMGVAILRYRLYDFDRVISRTITYVLLTTVLAAAYAGLVLAGERVFSSFAGGSSLAIAASTLVVAALFQPLRRRVQHAVDRRFNRRRYDAEATVAAFGARLRDAVDPETVLGELAAAAGGSLHPAHVSVWVRAS